MISFHTFRHFNATMLYHKTKDILYIMQMLRHKNIRNTLIYTQLTNLNDDDYVAKTNQTTQEISKLVEAGFEYLTDINNITIFRKRK